MTWRIELGAAAVTMGAALMWGASADSALDAPRLEQPDHFTHADYQAFDRDFRFGGTVCEVGLKRKGICFGVSPFEDGLSEGQTIPASLPDMPAEFPVILKTQLKADGLETWRFGRALVLVRSGTREIEDVMYLTAPYDERGETVLASR